MKNIEPKETEIQLAVCEYLSYQMRQGKLMFWRQNTNAIFSTKTGSFRAMPKYSMNGVSDIIVVRDGFVIFLEIKRPSGKQSDNQKQFQDLVKKNGAEYWVIRDLDDLKEIGL